MKLRLVIISLLSITLFSCKTNQLNILKPSEEYQAPVIETKPSTIGLNMDVDVQKLEKSINNNFKGLIYEDNNLDDDNMMIKVWKQQDFQFAVNGNKLTATIPLKVWVKAGFKKSALGLTVQDYREANGAISVSIFSVFTLDKNWNITTNTTVTNYNWTQTPTIGIAGYDLPITAVANLAIAGFRTKINQSIDDGIKNSVNTRAMMEKAWASFQQPMKANDAYNVWVKLSPTALYSTNIAGSGSRILFNLGLNTLIETSMGKALPAPAHLTKLPDYKVVNNIAPNFVLNSNIYLNYAKLDSIANDMMKGQVFKQAGKEVKIENIHLYGQNDHLVVEVLVSGAAKGTVYCVGKPVYDNATQLLTFTDFDFDMNTKNALIKSANWLLHKSFLKMIQPMLSYSMKDQLANLLNTSNNMLKNYEFQKGIMINGKINGVSLNKIYITPEALILNGTANGKLKIEIGELF